MSDSTPQGAQLVFKRYETKFLLSAEERLGLEPLIQCHMVPDEHGPATVRNVYYDTPTALLARRSAAHPAYKEKIRTRCYGAPHPFDPVFLELKKKCDGVVYKRRCSLPPADAREMLAGRGRPSTQIEREIDWAIRRYEGLRACAFLAYERCAYYGPNDRDLRVTFDDSVRVRWEDVRLTGSDAGELVFAPGTSIMEVKTCGAIPLWLVRYLSGACIRRASVSKYGRAWELREADLRAACAAQPETPAGPAPFAPRDGTETPAPYVPLAL